MFPTLQAKRAVPEVVRTASLQCCAFLFTGGKSERRGLWRFVGFKIGRTLSLMVSLTHVLNTLNDKQAIAGSCACFSL